MATIRPVNLLLLFAPQVGKYYEAAARESPKYSPPTRKLDCPDWVMLTLISLAPEPDGSPGNDGNHDRHHKEVLIQQTPEDADG